MREQTSDTVIIGAGHSGLAVSYCLTQQERAHVLLEKDQIGAAWRSAKWDSFTLVSPNWTLQLPGFPYRGNDPDGYLARDEIVQYLDDYVRLFDPPVRSGVAVTALQSTSGGFRIDTDSGAYTAQNVVVATGAFQKPRIPACAERIPPHIHQIHSSHYRNPDVLPPGAVLVVGSAQSGCQISEDLLRHGRKVYLCTGKAARVPRRYRDLDIFHWLNNLGAFTRTVDKLESPDDRFAPNPQLTGTHGGQAYNLHRFAEAGVTLLGRLQDAEGGKVMLAGDLKENLAVADKAEIEIRKAIGKHIAENGLQTEPESNPPQLQIGYDCEIITELDLEAAGIASVVWATGFGVDFSWIQLPIFDEHGYPVHQRGVTEQPGLYFIGLRWQHTLKSSLFLGIAEDAEYIAACIANRNPEASFENNAAIA